MSELNRTFFYSSYIFCWRASVFLRKYLCKIIKIVIAQIRGNLCYIFCSFCHLLGSCIHFSADHIIMKGITGHLLKSRTEITSAHSDLCCCLFRLQIFFYIFICIQDHSCKHIDILCFICLQTCLIQVFFPLFHPFQHGIHGR